MTTAQIVSYANEDGLVIGSADINLEARLRRKVIPKFEMDVGECAWRRKTDTLSITAGVRDYDLPADFGKLLDLPVLASSDEVHTGLTYIGEDSVAMALAEADTTPGRPGGYWFIRVTGPPTALRAIRLSKIPEQAFSLGFAYISEIQFGDLITSVELNNYMPEKFQWALVEALKMEIYAGRISIGDNRLLFAKENYDSLVYAAQEYREPGMRVGIKRVKMSPM